MQGRAFRARCAAVVVISLLLSPAVRAARQPEELILAREEIPAELRLDVGVQVLDPGLPEGPDGETMSEADMEAAGVFPHMRRSEGRYIAFQIRNVLEETGHWGAVRVIPKGLDTVDVTIRGEIRQSTGKELVLRIEALDATGRRWFSRKFKQQADPHAYNELNPEEYDPYVQLYYRVANDLLRSRNKIKADDTRRIRETSQLRFAADLAPDAFSDYYKVNKKGRYTLLRLPAEQDPMIARVELIRERDYMLIDTLNDYYAGFVEKMDQPYDDWREYSYEEQVALQKMRRQALWSQILGAALVVGGAAAGADSTAGKVARDAAIVAGGMVIADGVDKRKESKMHVEALRELAQSFDAEIEPLLLEVEGQTVQLQGSAEAQYANWRRILRAIFATETGLPLDVDGVIDGKVDDINRTDVVSGDADTPDAAQR